MFTGLVEELGKVRAVSRGAHSIRLTVGAEKILAYVKLGDSIAVDGVCLTVTGFDAESFKALVSAETLRRTSLGERVAGDVVNLENPVSLSKMLGGHMVLGHVDGVGRVEAITPDGECQMWAFSVPDGLGKFLVWKGSVAIDGISLTVVDVGKGRFSVTIIPKTLEATNFRQRKPGDAVNIETDIIGKYVYRFLHPDEPMEFGNTLPAAG